MPLCPQITNTAVTVTLTADFTVTSVLPVGKNKTFYQTSSPTSGMLEGDLWVDTATSNKMFRYTSGAWVSVQDGTIATAQSTASTAQSTATTALANAATAFSTAQNSLQPSAFAIQNPSTKQLTSIDATGLTVYSGASATSGARVVLNSTGLAGFDSGGAATFSVSASTGAAVFAGSVTGATITGGTLNIGGNCIINSSGFLTATGATITGAITATSGSFTGSIFASSGTIGGFTIGATSIYAGASLTINSDGTITGGNSATLFYGYANIGGGSPTGDRFQVSGTSNFNGTLTGTSFIATGSATFGASGQQFEFLSGSGNVRVASTYGQVASSRIMYVSTAGMYGTLSSTERKKRNIRPYQINEDALLSLDVKTFRFKTELDDDQNDQFGFIAEDADALGLFEITGYDKDGLPDYFAYEKLGIFLLPIARKQKAKIAELEERLTKLGG